MALGSVDPMSLVDQRRPKLPARADAQLREHLAQVPLHRARADEQRASSEHEHACTNSTRWGFSGGIGRGLISGPSHGTTSWMRSARGSSPSIWASSHTRWATATTGSGPSWIVLDLGTQERPTASSLEWCTWHGRPTVPSGSPSGGERHGAPGAGSCMSGPTGSHVSKVQGRHSNWSSSLTWERRTEAGSRTRWSGTGCSLEQRRLPMFCCSASRAKLAKRARVMSSAGRRCRSRLQRSAGIWLIRWGQPGSRLTEIGGCRS
jgi:hypothetical protein